MSNTSRTTRALRAASRVIADVAPLAIMLSACAPTARVAIPPPETAPPDYVANAARGASAFQTYCATCHGERARGGERGPPLVHRVYRSSHHSDMAFYKAVQRGVRAHHWNFGDMPAVAGVDVQTTADIVAYVRREQTAAGIEPVPGRE